MPGQISLFLTVSLLAFTCCILHVDGVTPSEKSAAIQYALRSRSVRIRKKAQEIAVQQEYEVRRAAEDRARLQDGGLQVVPTAEQERYQSAVSEMLRGSLSAAESVKSKLDAAEDVAVHLALERAASSNGRLAMSAMLNLERGPTAENLYRRDTANPSTHGSDTNTLGTDLAFDFN